MKIRAITAFCGSKSGNKASYELAAAEIGNYLALAGIQLVYGGGSKGIMGALANAVLQKKGQVLGIIPKLLLEWEAQHEGLTELIVTETMHERKLLLYERGDIAIVLPGGMGTLDELFEMLTWNNLRIHDKKVIVYNWERFYDPLLSMLDQMESDGFLYDSWKDRLLVCNDFESFQATMVSLNQSL